MSGVSTLLAGSPGGQAVVCEPPAPAPVPGPGGRQEPRAAGSPPGLRARARRAASPVHSVDMVDIVDSVDIVDISNII